MQIDPSKPPSSRPTAWSKVDLPDPEGPSSATISPGATTRSIPRKTSIRCPPCSNERRSPFTARTSLIAQYLHRIGACRLPGGIERRQEAEEQGHHRDDRDLDRIG